MEQINELTHKIIGSAMKVHSALGNGFQACLPKGSSARRQEVIYQRALAVEFDFQEVPFEREKEMHIHYREVEVGTRRVDFLVDERVMVELKAISELLPAHKAQAINYCEAYGLGHGLLINFGKTSLEFKRVYNKNLVNPANQKNPVQDNE